MRKLCILILATVFGYVGWWIGDHIGIMMAFLVSSIGSIAGIYVGWKIHRDYLS